MSCRLAKRNLARRPRWAARQSLSKRQMCGFIVGLVGVDTRRFWLCPIARRGVDDSRAKCLGLLATIDLDVVMTSEREWGCYPQVPGLAIAQLSRHDGIDAVLVTPWWWDGSERVRVPRPTAAQPYS